jgi:hypothetical protein
MDGGVPRDAMLAQVSKVSAPGCFSGNAHGYKENSVSDFLPSNFRVCFSHVS